MKIFGFDTASPRGKGVRSIAHGIGALGSYVLNAFGVGLTSAVGFIGLAALGVYNFGKSIDNLYKSSKKENKGARSGYFGRGTMYGLRGFLDITVPYISGLMSIYSGEERIRTNDYMPWDFANVYTYEQQKLKEIEEGVAAQEEPKPPEQPAE